MVGATGKVGRALIPAIVAADDLVLAGAVARREERRRRVARCQRRRPGARGAGD